MHLSWRLLNLNHSLLLLHFLQLVDKPLVIDEFLLFREELQLNLFFVLSILFHFLANMLLPLSFIVLLYLGLSFFILLSHMLLYLLVVLLLAVFFDLDLLLHEVLIFHFLFLFSHLYFMCFRINIILELCKLLLHLLLPISVYFLNYFDSVQWLSRWFVNWWLLHTLPKSTLIGSIEEFVGVVIHNWSVGIMTWCIEVNALILTLSVSVTDLLRWLAVIEAYAWVINVGIVDAWIQRQRLSIIPRHFQVPV